MSESESAMSESDSGDEEVNMNEKEIISAIKNNKIERLRGTDVNVCLDNEHQYSALHFAAHFNRPAIVEKLLDMNADITMKDSTGNRPVNIAAELGHDEVISIMVKHNPKCIMFEGRFGSIPLHPASRQGHFNVVKVLMDSEYRDYHQLQLQAKCKTENYSKEEQTPLHLAAKYGHVKIVKHLLDYCSKFKFELANLKNSYGETPVHVAAFKGRVEVIEAMIEKYPNCLEYRDDHNSIPFLTACKFGRVQLVRKLINDHNANINSSYTTTIIAEDDPNSYTTTIIAEDDPNIHDKSSQKPLVRACKYGRTMVVRLLFDKGVRSEPLAMVEAIRGGYRETVKELLISSKWKEFMQHSYEGEDGEDTTPFQELVRYMPDIAEIVLNKCMNVHDGDDGHWVTFSYEFVEDNGETETKHTGQSKRFKKQHHPLSLIVKYKRNNLLSHPLIASLIHHKWKSLCWISLLHWIFFFIHLCFVTALTLILSLPDNRGCVNGMSSNERSPPPCEHTHRIKSNILLKILATETVAYSLLSLVIRALLLFLSLKHVFSISMKDRKETNSLCHLRELIACIMNLTTVTEVSLFTLSIVYAIPVYWLDNCLCPLNWQLGVGAVVILLTWLEFIIISSHFHFIGVYALMLSRVFVSFLKTSILLCLLISGFGLVFYLTLNDPHVAGSTYLAPHLTLLKVTEETVGKHFNLFVHANDVDTSKEHPHTALTFLFWIIFIIIMPVLFTNLLIGLAVGDIQAIFNMAHFEKCALQIDYILTVEDYLNYLSEIHTPHCVSESRSKPYNEYSLCEMIVNRLIVFLWGGECFDSFESNQRLLEHIQTFRNSHRMTSWQNS